MDSRGAKEEPFGPIEPTLRRLRRRLLFVALGSFAALLCVVVIVSSLSIERVEAAAEQRVENDALEGARSLGERVAGRDDEERLGPEVERIVSESRLFVYAAVLSPEGRVLARAGSDVPPTLGMQLPSATAGIAGAEDRRVTRFASVSGFVIDHAVRAEIGGRPATVHVGVSEARVIQEKQRARRIAQTFAIGAAVACFLVLGATAASAWILVRRSRALDLAAIRRDHLAEIGALASGLVHEVRNPLNAMRMRLATLRASLAALADARPGNVDDEVAAIEAEVIRLERLAAEFLKLGRAAAGEARPVSPGDVVREVAESLRPALANARVTVALEVPPGVEAAAAIIDPEKLRQALQNLAENARAAMPEGGTLTFRITRPASRLLRIEVSDTGRGIAPEDLPRVFEAFFTRREGGTGLGLAIVKRIIVSAGGDVRVDSRPGAGARFTIDLPAISRARIGAAGSRSAPMSPATEDHA